MKIVFGIMIGVAVLFAAMVVWLMFAALAMVPDDSYDGYDEEYEEERRLYGDGSATYGQYDVDDSVF